MIPSDEERRASAPAGVVNVGGRAGGRSHDPRGGGLNRAGWFLGGFKVVSSVDGRAERGVEVC